MARIRSIKPEFFTSEQVAECSPNARLLFVGLWCFCDDGGVHPASFKRLKMEVFPGDAFGEADIQKMVGELLEVGLLHEFESEGQRYWHVTGWDKHQRIDKPTIKYPRPDASNSATIRRPFDEPSTNGRRLLDPGLEGNGLERRGEEGNGLERAHKSAGRSPEVSVIPSKLSELIQAWNNLPSGIASQVVKPDAKPVLAGWKRLQSDPEAAAHFEDVPALMAAILESRFLHGQNWFVFAWLFGKGPDRATWNVSKVMSGQYRQAARKNNSLTFASTAEFLGEHHET